MSHPAQSAHPLNPQSRWLDERGFFLRDSSEAHRLLKQVNGAGMHLLAVEIAEEIIAKRTFDDTVPVLQQMARALVILGSSEEALTILKEIPSGRADAAETLGLLARVWKDLAVEAEDSSERERCFRESLSAYSEGFALAEASGDAGGAAYCGINAAAVAVWLGEMEGAKRFATKAAIYAEGDDGYYGIATRAEAALILGRGEEAEELYRRASELGEAEKRWADIASTRRQCRALSLSLYGRRDRMDGSFSLGSVAVVSIQPEAKGAEDRIAAWLLENGACHVFIEEGAGCEAIPKSYEIHLMPPTGEGVAARRFCDQMIAARGALLASHLGVAMHALTVGDDAAATAAGEWRGAGLVPFAIFPGRSQPDGVPEPDVPVDPVPFPRAVGAGVEKVRVLAVLHLHFSGSKAPGKGILDLLAARLAASDHPPVCTQGHGGDYVFAFQGLRHAALCAISFAEVLENADCVQPAICLHAGLVEMDVNPLLHLYAPEGETVSRCGDIAAALPPGAVCATETFTALCALESVRGFRFNHSGTIESAGGNYRLFSLQPTTKL